MDFGIKGNSKHVGNMLSFIHKAAATSLTVLIEGESGTGKELIANAIHASSPRKKGPFISVNCGSLPQDLFENELFGHEPGAFSGATGSKQGLFEMADNGTLFIDEVGEMKPGIQVKFLRVLETGKFMRLGGLKEISVNVRIVAATNRVLETEIEKGNFRMDLYYRLCVLRMFLPPLRERTEDLHILANHFMEMTGSGKKLGDDAVTALSAYKWPGNIRELKNTVDRLCVLTDGTEITGEAISRELAAKPGNRTDIPDVPDIEGHSFDSFVEAAEKELLKRALVKYRDNRSAVADALKISRDKLYRKLKQYGIQ